MYATASMIVRIRLAASLKWMMVRCDGQAGVIMYARLEVISLRAYTVKQLSTRAKIETEIKVVSCLSIKVL